jgi:PAS domain S-box-containing protein
MSAFNEMISLEHTTRRISMNTARSILDALGEPVLVLDESLHAVFANRRFTAMLEIDPERLEGKPVQDLICLENSPLSLRAVLETAARHENRAPGVEVVCLIPPDKRRTVSLSVRRVILRSDDDELVLVELRDITDEKETERRVADLNAALRRHARELEDINVELESFTHSVSHDLRSPLRLTNKIGNLLLEQHGAELSSGAIEKLHMILTSTQEMSRLIEDLLRFSQISREPMKKRKVDLKRVAREAVAKLRNEGHDRDAEIVIEELPGCQADRALVKQVFINLLDNALKFAQPGKKAKVRVGFQQEKGQTVYFVQDNGVGFDGKHSESMFLAFHRLHRSGEFAGSGIGLALVRRVVERHGGHVWAEGEAGRGATISFTLGERPAG